MTVRPVDVTAVRRWIRRTQSAHRDRGETFGTFYFAVLLAAVVGGMLHRQAEAVFWPAGPDASLLAGVALTVLVLAVLHLALRRLGPIALSRPAVSWLLTAPVDRRRLLTPSLVLAAVPAAAVGALAAVAIVGHVAPRPVPGALGVLLPAIGAVAGVAVLLIALAAQTRRRAPRSDAGTSLLAAAGLGGLVVDSAVDAPRATGGWPADAVLVPAAAALTLVVAALSLLAVRRLARVPADRLLESARTAGTVADSTLGVEPSFVTDMVERRYWAGRRSRSVRLPGRLPVLVAQDLVLVRRRPGRLVFLAAATTVPILLANRPGWFLALAVLCGGVLAGSTSTGNVRTDAGNPVLLRLLGLGSRAAVAQRMWVPAVLSALWTSAALTLLRAFGVLPAGPWWALGLTLGTVGAIGAVRRARFGFVDNGLLPVDTPMGSVSTGPVLGAVVGFDALLFGLPTVVQIGRDVPLTWLTVLVQAVVGGLAVRTYLSTTTSADRVELAERV